MTAAQINDDERLRRWRLVLGAEAACNAGGGEGLPVGLSGDDLQMDRVLEALYDSERTAGLGSSCPNVNRWLGDIRTYFPSPVVHVMQRDALQRLNLQQMLLEPETLEAVDADIHLVSTLVSLKNVIPKKTKETARQVVRKVVEDLERRLRNPLTEAVRGALNKATRTPAQTGRDRLAPHDPQNLHNYLPERAARSSPNGWWDTAGGGRRSATSFSASTRAARWPTRSSTRASSARVLASLRAITTRMIVFDTAVVDLTDELDDPVDLLFGVQLGGGTDINHAVGYCRGPDYSARANDLRCSSPISSRAATSGNCSSAWPKWFPRGVSVICLLALNDEGTPCFSEPLAAALAGLGVPTFGCTPELFPGLMAAAIGRQDGHAWAA